MNLINLESSYDPKWFLTIAVHYEFIEIDHMVYTIFFYKIGKNRKRDF